MIYEFAVDPELLLHWAKSSQFKFWRGQFGLGQPRVATALSSKKKWKKLAREVLQKAQFASGLDSTRAEQLVKLMSGDDPNFPVVERPGATFEGNVPWLDNALREHNRYPLQGILTPTTHRIEAVVIDATDYSVDSPAWDLPAEAPVPRTAEDFSRVLGPMLRAARTLVIIDPYMDFHQKRWRDPILALTAQATQSGVPLQRLILVTGNRIDAKELERQWREAVRRYEPALCMLMPPDAKVTVRVIAERRDGQKLHDRFVLTEIGGARFTVGLDTGVQGQTDGCHRLAKAHWEEAWRDYVECKSFDLVEEW
jgi:hypothetical protein